jgi:hypothetical protein
VTVNLAAYAVKANNLSDLTNFTTARDNLALGTANTPTFAGVNVPGAGTSVANLGATFLTLNQSGHGQFTIQPSQGIVFPNGTIQTTAFTGVPADFITSVSSPLSVTSGNLTIDLSAYLTSATASATYAVIAAGQPTSGTVGQVLTKNSGTNYDSSWTTLIPGDRYLTSSTTSLTINNANKTLTIGTGLSYTPTQSITISYDASNHMHGEVLTYNSGTGVLTVDINHHTGSGTYSAWVVNVGGVVPATSVTWGSITGTLGAQGDLATALSSKLEVTTAASTYQTLSGMSAYLTTASAATSYYPLSGNPSGFLTSAPVTSVAGRTGAITLSNTDISGLGGLAVINDAPSDGSTYGRENGAWVVAGGGSFDGGTINNNLVFSSGAYLVFNDSSTLSTGAGLLQWKGQYEGANSYSVRDLVIYNGLGYICISSSSGNDPTNTSYWTPLGSQGPQGPEGPQGPQGPQGEPGTSGVSNPGYSNAVWYNGTWYSANLSTVYDTSYYYINVLSF